MIFYILKEFFSFQCRSLNTVELFSKKFFIPLIFLMNFIIIKGFDYIVLKFIWLDDIEENFSACEAPRQIFIPRRRHQMGMGQRYIFVKI